MLGLTDTHLRVADDENVLVVPIVMRKRVSVFVAAFAANEDFAVRFFLEFLLVNALWPDNESDIVDALKLWQEYLCAESLSRSRVV